MRKIISIINQKGGVGKTTTAVNLATCFSIVGKSVLLVDLDPQGNTSSSVGIDQSMRNITIYDVLIGRTDINNAIIKTAFKLLDLIPANVNLLAAEIELINVRSREFVLQNYLSMLSNQYDYVIIDCPPALGLLSMNSLVAANEI